MIELQDEKEYVNKVISVCRDFVNASYLNSNLYISNINKAIYYSDKGRIINTLYGEIRREKPELLEECTKMITNYQKFETYRFKEKDNVFIFTYVLTLFAQINLGKLSLSTYLITLFAEENDMQSRFVAMGNDITIPFIDVLTKIEYYSGNYEATKAYLFETKMPYKDDLDNDTAGKTIEAETVDSILSSLDRFSTKIKMSRLNKKTKRQIGAILESILYTYQNYKDFKSLSYNFIVLENACTRLNKSFKNDLNTMKSSFRYYANNYISDPEKPFDEIENKIHSYELKK